MWDIIEEHLEKKGMSIYTLAKRCNVSDATLHNIKHGRSKNPTFKLMCKIADVLEIDVNEFRKA